MQRRNKERMQKRFNWDCQNEERREMKNFEGKEKRNNETNCINKQKKCRRESRKMQRRNKEISESQNAEGSRRGNSNADVKERKKKD